MTAAVDARDVFRIHRTAEGDSAGRWTCAVAAAVFRFAAPPQ